MLKDFVLVPVEQATLHFAMLFTLFWDNQYDHSK